MVRKPIVVAAAASLALAAPFAAQPYLDRHLDQKAERNIQRVCELVKEGRSSEAVKEFPVLVPQEFIGRLRGEATSCRMTGVWDDYRSPDPLEGRTSADLVEITFKDGRTLELYLVYEERIFTTTRHGRLLNIEGPGIKGETQ